MSLKPQPNKKAQHNHCVKSIFGVNTGKYRPDITPYLEAIQAVNNTNNNTNIKQNDSPPEQKFSGLILDTQLNFEEHLKMDFAKTIGLIRKFKNSLQRTIVANSLRIFC